MVVLEIVTPQVIQHLLDTPELTLHLKLLLPYLLDLPVVHYEFLADLLV